MPFLTRGASAIVMLALLCAPDARAQWIALATGTDAELRGLSVVSPRVVWTSGARGTVLHTTDGGRTWTHDTVPGASALDFRAIAATSARVAHVMSIADSSRIYRTTDGGRTWSLRFSATRKGSFFDAIRFWDAQRGIAISDPVNGKFLVVTTSDGGTTWREMPPDRLPPALPGEGAFAASGSCLTVRGSGDVWFGTGGASVARIFRSRDGGKSWTVHDTPLRAGVASAGVFSVAFRDAKHGVIAGGDYQQPALRGRNVAFTSDGGRTWSLTDSASSPGYRSAIAYVPGASAAAMVAVGLTGSDLTRTGGASWVAFDTTAYNSVQFSGTTGWAVGAKGRIARLVTFPRR